MYILYGDNNNTHRRVPIHLVDATDGITAKTGQTGTANLMTNWGSPKTSRNSIVEVDSVNAPGDYYLELTTLEIKDLGVILVRVKTSASAEYDYVVQVVAFDPYQPISLQPGFNQAVAPDIDYKRISKLVTDAVGQIPKPPKPAKEADLTPVLEALHDLYDGIRAIDIPEPEKAEKLDLSPLDAKFAALEARIAAIHIPETDLTPVHSHVDEATATILGHINEGHEALKSHLEEHVQDSAEALRQAADEVAARPVQMSFQTSPPPQSKAPPEPKRDVLKDYLNTPK